MSLDSSSHERGPEPLPEDAVVPRPEDYLGRIIDSTYKVETIEAVGASYVVFRLRNMKTGEIDRVMKVPRDKFDAQGPLLNALPEAMEEVCRNPDRVIRICDRLLTIVPNCEAAAFDKGVALLMKNDPKAALQAFTLADTLQPNDVMNLVHKAACLAQLGRDEECLREFRAGADLGSGQLNAALNMVPLHAAGIHKAVVRLANQGAGHEAARQVLRDHFGLARRLRLLFHRFYS